MDIVYFISGELSQQLGYACMHDIMHFTLAEILCMQVNVHSAFKVLIHNILKEGTCIHSSFICQLTGKQ